MTSPGRERRKQATRRALRSAVLELGLTHGLAEVTVEEIAARAGVSPRTFFNYFATKEDAALLDLFTIGDDELDVFAAGPPEGAWTRLRELFAEDVGRVDRDGTDVPRWLALQAGHPALQACQFARFGAFERRLCDAVTTRLGGPDHRLRAEVMAGACITAVRVGLQHRAGAGPGGLVVHVDAAFDLLDPAFA
ncbi:TetR/AcrR family transcriptional regulator [Pseudonocardia abyssalis]|uniref:TetR family transcriptional regulator n=1 Tax=Pseudonocardia abyssalis TaxID=2792008 RepID=A0ABS6UX17_9PSEU|nr:TetR/AcrR family transcriptional regulator [Pseudonocardia abyssalis]MBW0115847.1 TetR family transcriptional regulator [Pseudonocardia abyssalis]MBW0136819.1 TetR family transcriptional regulator [Pseudonocardia abyssalis]